MTYLGIFMGTEYSVESSFKGILFLNHSLDIFSAYPSFCQVVFKKVYNIPTLMQCFGCSMISLPSYFSPSLLPSFLPMLPSFLSLLHLLLLLLLLLYQGKAWG